MTSLNFSWEFCGVASQSHHRARGIHAMQSFSALLRSRSFLLITRPPPLPHAGPYLSDANGTGSEFGREMSDMRLSPRLETQWEEERVEKRGREKEREAGQIPAVTDLGSVGKPRSEQVRRIRHAADDLRCDLSAYRSACSLQLSWLYL